jgi:ribulose-phosphate 3-epimerase
MLKCSTSLWSADLAYLAREIQRVEPYSERFHIDVADGHYVPNLLFFPDLVRACRRHMAKPMEVHLMTTDPLEWIGPFADAGADGFILCLDSIRDPADAFAELRRLGKIVGVSLSIPEPISLLEPYWTLIDQVTILGTPMGIKGTTMDPGIPDKVRSACAAIHDHGARVDIQVDGGIRRQTVPLIQEAGADWIVPGSLMFGEDPAEMRRWLAELGNNDRDFNMNKVKS